MSLQSRSTASAGVVALALSTAVLVCGVGAAGASYRPPPRRPAVIAAGTDHTLAIIPAGTVRAWGGNADGQLGNGSADDVSTAVTVEGFAGSAPLAQVVEVAASYASSYALLADGTVAAWGSSDAGQLGNGSTVNSFRPVHVTSTSGHGVLTGVISVAAAGGYVIALRADGSVVAWGYNLFGTLGDGTTTNSSRPVVVHGPGGGALSDIVAITAANSDAYAITGSGTVYAWGEGATGELGNGTMSRSTVPVQVSGIGGTGALSQVVQVSAGAEWAAALRSNGTVVAWGDNTYGELGNATNIKSFVPEPITALGDHIVSLARSEASQHAGAIGSSGAVYEWGLNAHGQLGDGSTTDRNSPVRVVGLVTAGVVQVALGQMFTIAVTGHGAVYAWGANNAHQLGDGGMVDASSPALPDSPVALGLPKLFLLKAPVLGGHAAVGGTLSVTAGTWGLPATGHAYQWLRDGRAIAEATKATYRVSGADRGHHISVRVSASRTGYPGNMTTTRSVRVAG